MSCRSAPGWTFLSCFYTSMKNPGCPEMPLLESKPDKARKMFIVPYLGAASAQ